MTDDLLAVAAWECCSTPPGAASNPEELGGVLTQWRPASVPGTAAGAWRASGMATDGHDFDAGDWWFRCRFAGPGPAGTQGSGPWVLSFGGLATLADVWLNEAHLLHSENMFVRHDIELAVVDAENELLIRCGSLVPWLAVRRPRPRWKGYLVSHQNLRWLRTTLLGRMPGWAATPAPVGPWRPVTLQRSEALRIVARRVVASCEGDDGVVDVMLRLGGSVPSAELRVGDHRGTLTVRPADGGAVGDTIVEGSVLVPGAPRWWPHTHGAQPRYPVSVEVGGTELSLGHVGFRTISVTRDDGDFRVHVNGVAVFCRGATWMAPDPVTMVSAPGEDRATLELLRQANMNMVRLPATGVYQDEAFFDACDELGILVWQDLMFAFMDPPDDDAFVAEVQEELIEVFSTLGGRPSLAVVCGGQEIQEQAAMLALSRDKWTFPLLEQIIPAIVERELPGTAYVADNPTGGGVPFQMNAGVSQFFGIGGYLRPVEDARRAGVRFASECLAFATPPEPQTIDEACGGVTRAGHDPQWKLSVHHDAGRSWDLEDMQSHYVGRLFGVDPFVLRWQDAERALELARATVAELMSVVFSEWRHPGSTCAGALVLALRDLRPGGGWGIIDALGRPKAPWYALRRVLQPVAVLLSDEGLNGLRLHVVNDTGDGVEATVVVRLFAVGELCIEEGRRDVSVPARQSTSLDVLDLFDGFRDLTAAYGFGPPPFDVVAASLVGADGHVASEAFHLPLGLARPLEPDLGLQAVVSGPHSLAVSTRRFAEFVAVDVPGYRPSESWFHLAPGATRHVELFPEGESAPPALRGHVRALNSQVTAPITLDEGE